MGGTAMSLAPTGAHPGLNELSCINPIVLYPHMAGVGRGCKVVWLSGKLRFCGKMELKELILVQKKTILKSVYFVIVCILGELYEDI